MSFTKGGLSIRTHAEMTGMLFVVVRKLNSTTSAAVIYHLKSVFAEHGIPETLVSDNGPQYNSQELAAFCKQWGIDHMTSSPLYPQGNGFIERSVQTVKNAFTKSRSLGGRSIHVPGDADISYHTCRQQPTIARLAAEPQRLPHTVAVQQTSPMLTSL